MKKPMYGARVILIVLLAASDRAVKWPTAKPLRDRSTGSRYVPS